MSGTTLDELHRDLEHLSEALAREEFGVAGDVLARHDARLREYIDTVGLQAPLQALSGLLRLQHELQANMATTREAASEGLRSLRASSRASRQYREAAS